MSVNEVFHGSGLYVISDGDSAVSAVGGVGTITVKSDNSVRGGVTDGAIQPEFQAVDFRKQEISGDTTSVALMLDLVDQQGKCIKAGAGPPVAYGLRVYGQAADCSPPRKAGSSHLRYTMAGGLLVPQTLSVDGRDDARITWRAPAISVGGNEAVVFEVDQTLPADVLDKSRFGLYKQSVAGVLLSGVKGMTLEFAVTVTEEDADGSDQPEWISVGFSEPVVTLRGINPKWLATSIIPQKGKLTTLANTKLRLRKRAHGTNFVPIATPEHIEIGLAGLADITTWLNTSGAGAGTCDMRISGAQEGGSLALSIDTTAILPA